MATIPQEGLAGDVVLVEVEQKALATCEAVIDRGMKTFVEVGAALLRIRDQRLYRAEFPTFEAYCQKRWSLGRKRAYDLTAGAEVADLLSPIGDSGPANEAQARELAPLRDDPDALRAVWSEAVNRSGGQPTAASIRQVRDDLDDTPRRPAPARSASASSTEAPAISRSAGPLPSATDPVPDASPLGDFIEADAEIQWARRRLAFNQAATAAGRVLEFDPDEVRRLIEEDSSVALSLRFLRERLNSWFSSSLDRPEGGLRVVSGGRR